jgi:hypothetical protein
MRQRGWQKCDCNAPRCDSDGGGYDMNKHKFSAEVARQARVPNAAELFREAATLLSDRAYPDILVQADWTPLASDDDVVRMEVTVIGQLAPRDVPAYVELFFHDAFLLFNIALPGSFGGAITVTGGEFGVNDLSFDAAPFACGASSMPLAEVVAWCRGGTSQITCFKSAAEVTTNGCSARG